MTDVSIDSHFTIDELVVAKSSQGHPAAVVYPSSFFPDVMIDKFLWQATL